MDVSLFTATAATATRGSKTGEPVGKHAQVDQPAASSNASEPARQPLEQAVANIEGFVQKITRDLNFSLDDSTGRMVIKVTDRASGDVVRQIPSEEALRLAENLEQVRSLLFSAEA